MGLEQQSDVLGKWCYPAKKTSDSGNRRVVHSCKKTNLIIASTFERNRRRHQFMWRRTTPFTPEEQRKRKTKTLKLQLDYVLTRNIRLSVI
ncbi:hypothetical protein RB195_016509 [Necator americanus]|uniref:Uncharacterized protein n=1 Tax=Necator americanus TaxID=51031 RepID=A0ABR1C0S2_NECAM